MRRADAAWQPSPACAMRQSHPADHREDTVSQLSSDDRLAIAELVARYCHAIDHGRWEELGSLFTDDCRLDFGKVMGVFEGRAGLERFITMLRTTGVFMRHYTTNLVVRGDSERARAESYVLAMTGAPGNLHQTTGRYDDEFVKSDGQWRFRERRAVIEMG